MYKCPICIKSPWSANSRSDMTEHLKLRHKKSPKSGKCPYLNCSKNFGDIYKYMNHVDKDHKAVESLPIEIIEEHHLPIDCSPAKKIRLDNKTSESLDVEKYPVEITNFSNPEEESTFDEDLLEYHKQQSARAADFVKDLYADISLSRSAIDRILSSFIKYENASIEQLKRLDTKTFTNNKKLDMALKIYQSSFSNVNSESKVLKHLTLEQALIMPIAKTVDIRPKLCLNKKTHKRIWTEVKTQIQIVPMNQVLKKYLELPNVFSTILKSLNASDVDYPITSFVQGDYWRKITSQCSKLIIPLSISFDDLELNNPLGSHKAKIGAIYYTITCLSAEFSAKLDNWFLSQFHHEKDYKRLGNKIIFGTLKNQLVDLQDNGIEIETNGARTRVYFRVVRFIGDNLGLNEILGFVGGFNATHYCRVCMVNSKDARKLLEENTSLLRNRSNYNTDVENAIKIQDHSRGVRERSVFEPVIHVTDIITTDILHDWLEGIDRLEIAGIIYELMFQDKNIDFNVDDLNTNIKLLKIGSENGVNIPSTIEEKSILKKHLKLTASEMFFMVQYLGILIGKYVPRENKYWQLYLLLRKIHFLIMAPSFNEESPNLLKDLIKEHHQKFDQLNLGNRIPKHHFVLHYPSAMKQGGPLRYAATFRSEAVHQGRKITARTAISRKNICYTLAKKYQLVLAKKFVDRKPMVNTKQFKLKKNMQLKALENFNKFENTSSIEADKYINLLASANYDGTIYKAEVNVLIEKKENNLPTFAKIKYIIESEGKVYFIVNKQHTNYLDEHVQSYVIDETSEWLFIEHKDLVSYEVFYDQIVELSMNSIDRNGQIKLETKKVIPQTYV